MNILKPSDNNLKALVNFYKQGRYDEAKHLAQSITNEFPDHPLSWKILGILLFR